ncbi:GPR1/FUN34/yaaH family [Aspergillus sp. HF37]|nr:GPR1/FUN34/yaaH family [Aspergillus sp. HF37]
MTSNDVAPVHEKENNSSYSEGLPKTGGHVDDSPQSPPAAPGRRVALPSPLGLIAFATSIFVISVFGLRARGVQSPNVMVGVLLFFGGLSQFVAGIMEFVTGNTFGATVFSSYAALNFSYGLIYLPGSGIMAAYMDSTGAVTNEFNQAVAIYMWAWFIVSCLFTVSSYKSTWVIFIDLVMVDILLLLLACGFMVGVQGLLTAGYSFGIVVCFLTYYAGCTAMWADTPTPVQLPPFAMV